MFGVDAGYLDSPLESPHILEEGIFDGVIDGRRGVNAPAARFIGRSEKLSEIGT